MMRKYKILIYIKSFYVKIILIIIDELWIALIREYNELL